MRPALSRRGFRENHVGPPTLPVGAVPRPARHPAPVAVQGRVHRQRFRGRRRQHRLCLHAVPCRAGVLRQPAVGCIGRLGGHAQAPLRHRRTHARRRYGSLCQRQPGAGAGACGAPRRREYLQAHAGRHLLRRAGQVGARPLLRRRGAAAQRLHALWRLHGRLSRRRQEHAGQELPVVRREARRAGAGRDRGCRHRAAGRGRRQRRLPGHGAAPRRLAVQAPPDVHRARRGACRRGTGYQSPARELQASRDAAPHQRPARRTGAHQQRVGPGRAHARRPARTLERRGDKLQHPPEARHAHRIRHLWSAGRLHVDAVHAADRQGHAAHASADAGRQHPAAPAALREIDLAHWLGPSYLGIAGDADTGQCHRLSRRGGAGSAAA